MILLGLIMVVLVLLMVLAVFIGNSDDETTLDLGLVEITTSTETVFWLGAAAAVVLYTGILLLRRGVRRELRHRRELRTAREAATEYEHGENAEPYGGSNRMYEDPDGT